MPRPKSADPKRALTIRLRSSLVERLGGEAKARAAIEVMVERAMAKRVETPAPPPKAAIKVETAPKPAFKSRLKGEWKAP